MEDHLDKLDARYENYISKIKLLSFKMGNSLFAVDVNKVQEIIEDFYITRIPRLPSFIKGIYNQRGSIVPVVDLRKKLEIEPEVDDEMKEGLVVVEVKISDSSEIFSIGIIVDNVEEVIECYEKSLDQSMRYSLNIDSRFIKGLFTSGEGENFVILLDIDVILEPLQLAEAAGLSYFWHPSGGGSKDTVSFESKEKVNFSNDIYNDKVRKIEAAKRKKIANPVVIEEKVHVGLYEKALTLEL